MNVLFILVDSLRFDTLDRNTDRLEFVKRLINHKSTIYYKNAISPAGWTQPAMASIFTGKYSSMQGDCHLNRKYKLLQQIFNKENYITAYISSNAYFSTGTGVGEGFKEDCYFNNKNFHKKLSPKVIFKSLFGQKDFIKIQMLNNQALNFIKRNKKNRFFLYLHHTVHSPYRCFRKYKKGIKIKYGSDIFHTVKIKKIQPALFMSPDTKKEEKKCLYEHYEKNLLSLDKYINKILMLLEEWDLIEDTLIILTSDHGEHFGEKGVFGHDYTLYDQIIKVPLIVKYPDNIDIINKNEDIVSTIDIFPTLIDILKIRKSFDYNLDGISLLKSQKKDRIVVSERIAHTRHINEHKKRYREVPDELFEKWNKIIVSFRNKKYKMIHSSQGDHEIYDLCKDPGEKYNLYRKINLSEFEKFRNDFFNKVNETKKSLKKGRKTSLDKAMKEQLKGLGYL